MTACEYGALKSVLFQYCFRVKGFVTVAFQLLIFAKITVSQPYEQCLVLGIFCVKSSDTLNIHWAEA